MDNLEALSHQFRQTRYGRKIHQGSSSGGGRTYCGVSHTGPTRVVDAMGQRPTDFCQLCGGMPTGDIDVDPSGRLWARASSVDTLEQTDAARSKVLAALRGDFAAATELAYDRYSA
jgi:hypothetical protein